MVPFTLQSPSAPTPNWLRLSQLNHIVTQLFPVPFQLVLGALSQQITCLELTPTNHSRLNFQ